MARSRRRPVVVIGYDGSPVTPAARAALHEATLVIGSVAHLDAVPVGEHARRLFVGDFNVALAQLALHDGPAVVIASGDPGFFGVVRTLREHDIPVRTIPAVSSVGAAFGRIGLNWDDALVVAVHGRVDPTRGGQLRTPNRDLRAAVNACRAHPKVAVLTGPGAGPQEIATALLGNGRPDLKRSMVVAQHLGQPDESVEWVTLEEAAERHAWGEPNVVLVLDDDRLTAPRVWTSSWLGPSNGWALPDNAFVHRGGVISRVEVRALALARLAPRPGMLIWDVGAGPGDMGIECARLGAAVIAVERDPDAAERISLNATMHGVDLQVVLGQAPDVLLQLPDPDAVFVGGGGVDVVRHCVNRGPRIVVAALEAVDRVPEFQRALRRSGRRVDGVLLHASRLAPMPGESMRFAATNPTFLLWGERPS
jgi:precorrin-6Y C5,15-methyltransferase (decarboxylating)